jgi:hypothetical protein
MKAIVVRVEEAEREKFLKNAQESLFGSGNSLLRAFIVTYNQSFPVEEAEAEKPKPKRKRKPKEKVSV